MTICTSYAGRNNRTMHAFLRRRTRLALGRSKEMENRVAAVCPHRAHCNS